MYLTKYGNISANTLIVDSINILTYKKKVKNTLFKPIQTSEKI